MPTYEYECKDCGHQLEELQKITDPPLRTCPACGKDELERLISATSFMLKGAGWSRDGYGKKEGKPRTENQRIDRLQKALDDDKKKTAAAAASDSSSTGSPGSSSSGAASGSSSGGSSSGSSSGGSSGGSSQS